MHHRPTPEDRLLEAALLFVSRRAGANVGNIEVSIKTDTGFRYRTSLPSAWLAELLSSQQRPADEPVTVPPAPLPSTPTPSQPPAPDPTPRLPRLQGCPREIVETLSEVGHRLTGIQLTSEMAQRGYDYSENTVRSTAGVMVEMGVLTNETNTNPRGYGLPEWANS